MAFAQIQAADWRKVCGSRRLSDQVRSPTCCLRIEVGVNFVCTMPFHEILSLPHWTFYQSVFDCGDGNHLLRQFLNCLIWRVEAVCRALTETQRLICSECPSPWLTVQPLRRHASPLDTGSHTKCYRKTVQTSAKPVWNTSPLAQRLSE